MRGRPCGPASSGLSMLEKILRYFMFFFSRDPGLLEQPGPFVREDWDSLLLWRFTETAPGIRIYFTSRGGGFSSEPYRSLNLAYHVGDDPVDVTGNRALLASILGLQPERITSPRQRHTANIDIVDENSAGAGAMAEESCFDPCDGLITDVPGVPLLLHFADCVPLIFISEASSRPVIGVAHAGRQGLMAGVVRHAVEKMIETADVSPGTMTVVIGPCIGQCCYQVDEETAREFAQRFGEGLVKNRSLDLRQAAIDDLTGAGIWRSNICIMEECTSCNSGFYSYRRDGVTGRHGALAWIE